MSNSILFKTPIFFKKSLSFSIPTFCPILTEPIFPDLINICSAVKSDGILSSYSPMDLPAQVIFFFRPINDVSGSISPSFNLESGYHETIEIEDYGLVRAKFDTGNGTNASMFVVDKLNVSDKNVKWEKNGKKFNSKLIGISKPTHVGVIDERPIVIVKVLFNNMLYENVPIGLTTKDAGSTFLVNRELLTRFKVSVNPNRKFVLSNWREREDNTDVIRHNEPLP